MYEKENNQLYKNYYVNESVGIALGFLIQSLHMLGYQSLTYTPSGMSFLQELFHTNEGMYPVMILAVGKADENYEYPVLTKKQFDDIAEII